MQQLGSVKGAQQGTGNLGRGHAAKGPGGCSCVLLVPTFHLCSHTQPHGGVSGWFGLNTGDLALFGHKVEDQRGPGYRPHLGKERGTPHKELCELPTRQNKLQAQQP